MNSTIDITPAHNLLLLTLFSQYIPGVAVWAYGSRIKSTAKRYSDLDLVAFTDSKERQAVANLREELAESNLPFIVDLHIWDEVPKHFQDIIRQDYRVVQQGVERSLE